MLALAAVANVNTGHLMQTRCGGWGSRNCSVMKCGAWVGRSTILSLWQHVCCAWWCLTTFGPSIIRVAAYVMLTDCIQQVCIPLQAVLMVMLKANLMKNCFTTTLMHRLSQFGASEHGIHRICKHMKYTQKSNLCLYALWAIQQFAHA